MKIKALRLNLCAFYDEIMILVGIAFDVILFFFLVFCVCSMRWSDCKR